MGISSGQKPLKPFTHSTEQSSDWFTAILDWTWAVSAAMKHNWYNSSDSLVITFPLQFSKVDISISSPHSLMSETKFVILQTLLYFLSLPNKGVFFPDNVFVLNIHFFAASCKYTLYWKQNNYIYFFSSSAVLGLILLLSWPDIFLAK